MLRANLMQGTSINRFGFLGSSIPLVYGGYAVNVSAGAFYEASRYCATGSLNSNIVKNSIVLCDGANRGNGVLMASALGTIMSATIDSDSAFSFPLPATIISVEDGATLLAYIQSTR